MPAFWSEQKAVDHEIWSKIPVVRRMHGALKKKEKDFFFDQVCPLVFLKRNVSDPFTISVMANSQSIGVDKTNTFTAR